MFLFYSCLSLRVQRFQTVTLFSVSKFQNTCLVTKKIHVNRKQRQVKKYMGVPQSQGHRQWWDKGDRTEPVEGRRPLPQIYLYLESLYAGPWSRPPVRVPLLLWSKSEMLQVSTINHTFFVDIVLPFTMHILIHDSLLLGYNKYKVGLSFSISMIHLSD